MHSFLYTLNPKYIHLCIILPLNTFICRKKDKRHGQGDSKSCCSGLLDYLKDILNIHEVTADENFVSKSDYSTKDLILQLFVVTTCLISFW